MEELNLIKDPREMRLRGLIGSLQIGTTSMKLDRRSKRLPQKSRCHLCEDQLMDDGPTCHNPAVERAH